MLQRCITRSLRYEPGNVFPDIVRDLGGLAKPDLERQDEQAVLVDESEQVLDPAHVVGNARDDTDSEVSKPEIVLQGYPPADV